MHWGSQEAPKKAHNENAEEDLRQQLLMCNRVRRDSRLGLDFLYFSVQISRLGLEKSI